jgi:hypothetical protein
MARLLQQLRPQEELMVLLADWTSPGMVDADLALLKKFQKDNDQENS